MPDDRAVDSRVVAHLRAIAAVPRPAGGRAETSARGYAAAVLRGAGYDVVEVPFTYSDVPGRLGTPIAGAWTALTFGGTAIAGARGRPGIALALLGAGVAALAVTGVWIGRFGTRRLRWRRRAGINLVATRGCPTPSARTLPGAGARVWLVAHLDSKSQPVPMVARVGGVVAAIGCATLAGGLLTAELLSARAVVGAAAWGVLGVLGIAVAAPIAATTVGISSDGALDNASGVAAVLGAAELLAAESFTLGVLLTSAEELGMAGAHAWADAWARAGRVPAVALNCDGVDDAGPLAILRGAQLPPAVARALATASARRDGPVRVRHIPPGLLVDAVALASAGWEAITVSKGTWATLGRVHTRRDTLTRLRGSGVAEAAALLAGLARVLVSARRD